MPLTPGQKQMIAIRTLVREELWAATHTLSATEPDRKAYVDNAFAKLCEAFGHEVPAE